MSDEFQERMAALREKAKKLAATGELQGSISLRRWEEAAAIIAAQSFKESDAAILSKVAQFGLIFLHCALDSEE